MTKKTYWIPDTPCDTESWLVILLKMLVLCSLQLYVALLLV